VTYARVFTALADPTRRHIFEALRERPKTVGELARRQPVSRPAVSQHLKVLEAAGLVSVEPRGTRRLYLIKRDGLEALRQYLDRYWSDVLGAYGDEVARRLKNK
jgi:DNA-binding transcriptional ArsR family regulator